MAVGRGALLRGVKRKRRVELEDNRKKRGTKKQGDWWVKAENQWEKRGNGGGERCFTEWD